MGGGRGMPLLTRCGSRVGRNAVMHNTAFRRCGRMCDRIIDRLKMPPQVQDAMLRPVPVVRGLVGDHVKPAAPSGPTKTIVDGLVVTIGPPALSVGGAGNLFRPNRWPRHTRGLQSKQAKRVQKPINATNISAWEFF
jgi:hypothetical protein